MATSGRPICWRCGFDLAGIRADGVCPECATPIWSRPGADPETRRRAGLALGWGIASLVLMFVCLGPLSAFVAIPAVVYGGRVRRDVAAGLAQPDQIGGANVGYWIGFAVIAFSLAIFCFYGIAVAFLAAPLIPFGVGP